MNPILIESQVVKIRNCLDPKILWRCQSQIGRAFSNIFRKYEHSMKWEGRLADVGQFTLDLASGLKSVCEQHFSMHSQWQTETPPFIYQGLRGTILFELFGFDRQEWTQQEGIFIEDFDDFVSQTISRFKDEFSIRLQERVSVVIRECLLADRFKFVELIQKEMCSHGCAFNVNRLVPENASEITKYLTKAYAGEIGPREIKESNGVLRASDKK